MPRRAGGSPKCQEVGPEAFLSLEKTSKGANKVLYKGVGGARSRHFVTDGKAKEPKGNKPADGRYKCCPCRNLVERSKVKKLTGMPIVHVVNGHFTSTREQIDNTFHFCDLEGLVGSYTGFIEFLAENHLHCITAVVKEAALKVNKVCPYDVYNPKAQQEVEDEEEEEDEDEEEEEESDEGDEEEDSHGASKAVGKQSRRNTKRKELAEPSPKPKKSEVKQVKLDLKEAVRTIQELKERIVVLETARSSAMSTSSGIGDVNSSEGGGGSSASNRSDLSAPTNLLSATVSPSPNSSAPICDKLTSEWPDPSDLSAPTSLF